MRSNGAATRWPLLFATRIAVCYCSMPWCAVCASIGSRNQPSEPSSHFYTELDTLPIQGGLVTGVPLGLAALWYVLRSYLEAVRVSWVASALGTVLNVLAAIVGIAALICIGIYALLLLREENTSWKRALAVGAGAGVVAGIVVYLFAGAAMATAVITSLSLTPQLLSTASLTDQEKLELLVSAIGGGLTASYLVMLLHLAAGAFCGALEALVFSRVRSLRAQGRT